MNGLEWNKVIASVLLASLIGMVVGKIVDVLYKPEYKIATRGYQVAVDEMAESAAQGASAAVFEVDIAALMSKASSTAGKIVFKKCASCHTMNKGGPNRVGPNLYNVLGAAKGHRSDFKYSSALTSKGGSWDYESLFQLLHKPSRFIKGTKMSFVGLKKPEDIANVIEYLRQEASDNPPPVPAAAPSE